MCQPSWCRSCNILRNSEMLPSVAQISEMLADLKAKGLSEEDCEFAKLIDETPDQFLANRLQKLEAQLRWRTARNSPARCLECGSTDLDSVTLDEDGFPHPNCGGTFQHVSMWQGLQSEFQILDTEGREVEVRGP